VLKFPLSCHYRRILKVFYQFFQWKIQFSPFLDKKMDGDILISLKSKEASLTQSINKNTPVKTTTMTIKEFKEYDQELDIRGKICSKNLQKKSSFIR